MWDNPRPGWHRAPVVRLQGIEAGFPLRSYAPGEPALLTLASDARSLRLQVFHYSSERGADFKTAGTAMTAPLPLDWRTHRNAPATLDFVRAGDWASGLYFLRASADDGRAGYAPFIVRPKRFGATSKVAVVLSTNTWQAYNFWDADGDGWGDSWYVSATNRRVDLRRPYLDFGVPFRFRDWDLDFIGWLNRTDRRVEFVSDDDLERFATAAALARAYDLIVFPGHAEYVTKRAYDLVEGYRNLGGNLLFLAANNFFWRVDREGGHLRRVRVWRELGRPEAALVGVQYIGSDYGGRQAGYVVAQGGWPFDGTGLKAGSVFGRYGIEIDARTAASPRGTATARVDPRPDGDRPLRRDDVLRERRAEPRSSRPGRSTSPRRSAIRPSRGCSRTCGRGSAGREPANELVLGVVVELIGRTASPAPRSTSRQSRPLGRLDQPGAGLGDGLRVRRDGPVTDLELGLRHVEHERARQAPRVVADAGSRSGPDSSTSAQSCFSAAAMCRPISTTDGASGSPQFSSRRPGRSAARRISSARLCTDDRLEAARAAVREDDDAPAVEHALDEVPLAGVQVARAVDRAGADERRRQTRPGRAAHARSRASCVA